MKGIARPFMKLSEYARKCGVTSRTAFRWGQNGQIKSFQKPSGTISVTEGEDETPVAKQQLIGNILANGAEPQEAES